MAQNALSITTNGTTKDQLAELQNQVIDNLFKSAVSTRLKNQAYSGDLTTGSVDFKRFVNAQANTYGTARAAVKGVALTATKEVLNIDTDKEIVEEVAEKDVKLYGVPTILSKRAVNHDKVMAAELDRAFFGQLVAELRSLNLFVVQEVVAFFNTKDGCLFFNALAVGRLWQRQLRWNVRLDAAVLRTDQQIDHDDGEGINQ